MGRSLWRIPVMAVVVASLGAVGGTAVGVAPLLLAAAYAAFLALAVAHAVIGLAIRENAWRGLSHVRASASVCEVAGHRLF